MGEGIASEPRRFIDPDAKGSGFATDAPSPAKARTHGATPEDRASVEEWGHCNLWTEP